MKRCIAAILAIVIFTGCAGAGTEIDRASALRNTLLKANECRFTAIITADYTDTTYSFKMNTVVDAEGNVSFTVTAPETISGITGRITAAGGELTFDNEALMFEMLADGQITPVSAPWLLISTLRSGYIRACGKDGEGIRIQIDDSYYGQTLHADIWTGADNLPLRGEFVWQGKRIVSIDVVDFVIV